MKLQIGNNPTPVLNLSQKGLNYEVIISGEHFAPGIWVGSEGAILLLENDVKETTEAVLIKADCDNKKLEINVKNVINFSNCTIKFKNKLLIEGREWYYG